MPKMFENKTLRPVRIFTEQVICDGLLSVGLFGRTLDELNHASRAFLGLTSPSIVRGELDPEDDPLVIGKGSVLFAIELEGSDAQRGPAPPPARKAQFQRLAVRLRLRDYRIEGYIHSLDRIDLLNRLNQASQRFIALTGTSVVGPDIQFKTPFLAVNIAHVSSAQSAFRIDAVLKESASAEQPSQEEEAGAAPAEQGSLVQPQ